MRKEPRVNLLFDNHSVDPKDFSPSAGLEAHHVKLPKLSSRNTKQKPPQKSTLQTCAPKHHGGITNPSRETLPRHAARFGNRIALDKVAGLK
jgi:hypothetical protein